MLSCISKPFSTDFFFHSVVSHFTKGCNKKSARTFNLNDRGFIDDYCRGDLLNLARGDRCRQHRGYHGDGYNGDRSSGCWDGEGDILILCRVRRGSWGRGSRGVRVEDNNVNENYTPFPDKKNEKNKNAQELKVNH